MSSGKSTSVMLEKVCEKCSLNYNDTELLCGSLGVVLCCGQRRVDIGVKRMGFDVESVRGFTCGLQYEYMDSVRECVCV